VDGVDVRLVQLLSSFIAARGEYALARLEFAMHFPDDGAPPLIDRIHEASEHALGAEWPPAQAQLDAALAFVQSIERAQRSMRDEPVYRRLLRCVRELDQYARAIAWVMTVSEREHER
jgi:hypothetical protein